MPFFDEEKEPNPFKANLTLSEPEITGYVKQALRKEGHDDVTVTYRWSSNGCDHDRFAIPSTKVTITTGAGESKKAKTVDLSELVELVTAELQSDGHKVASDGVSLSYDSYGKKVTGTVYILLPRKIKR